MSQEKICQVKEWTEVRLNDCEDGTLGHVPVLQDWARKVASFIVEKLGMGPSIQIYPYCHAGSTHLAVDIYNDRTHDYVAITILLADTNIYLCGPAGKQFDIALPGIIDAFSLVRALLSFTHGIQEPAPAVLVSLQDRPDALPHEPNL